MASEDDVERIFRMLLKAIKGDAHAMMVMPLGPDQVVYQDLGTCRVQIAGNGGMESYGVTVIAYKVDEGEPV